MSYIATCSTSSGIDQIVSCSSSTMNCCCYYDTLRTDPYCCNCNTNALLWWAWLLISLAIAVFVFFFICCIVCCVRRRRRLLAAALTDHTVMVGMDSTRSQPMITRQVKWTSAKSVFYWNKNQKKTHGSNRPHLYAFILSTLNIYLW